MSLNIYEIKDWVAKSFHNSSQAEELRHIEELYQSLDPHQEIQVLYELGKINADAGFMLWLKICQRENQKAFHSFFPRNFTNSKGETSDYSPAFRELTWINTSDVRKIAYDFYVPLLAGYVAGLKHQAFLKAKSYSENRYQGGKNIADWSLIRNQMNELYLEVHRESKIIPLMDFVTGLSILQTMDSYQSKCMQIFGGAGYIEDFEVENLFRICHFLKSWPAPFKEIMMSTDLSRGIEL